jgi:hypothetical protein
MAARRVVIGVFRRLLGLGRPKRKVPPGPPGTVHICSFPKSGRTFLSWLVACYCVRHHQLGVTVDLETLYSIVPESAHPIARHEAFEAGRIPRFWQTHTVRSASFDRSIFLMRHPYDTLVSYYFHQARHAGKFSGSLGEFISGPGLGRWVRYMDRWGSRLPAIDALVLRYEDLVREPGATLTAVLEFAGAAVDTRDVQWAVEQSSFEAMLASEARVPRRAGPNHRYDFADADARRIRRGKVGGWRDYLSAGEVRTIRRAIDGLSAEARLLLASYDLPDG